MRGRGRVRGRVRGRGRGRGRGRVAQRYAMGAVRREFGLLLGAGAESALHGSRCMLFRSLVSEHPAASRKPAY